MKNKQPKRRSFRIPKVGIIIALTIVFLAAVFVILASHSHKKAISGPIKTISTPTSETSNEKKSSATAPTDKSATVNSSAGSQSSSGGSPLSPYGSLVSNHKPGQNGSDLTELSQCITSPGAKCYIKFTQGSVVKTLPEKTADSSGSIFWEWNVSDAGLTSGDWTITASASLDGQTKSTSDQLNLEVQ